ncbi:MAG: hypothetical protein HQ572_02455, partial [Candidatus Omnitrophica bacterium]|nr:hypothetical protein [Candidatus Omnitrophota bacterium]
SIITIPICLILIFFSHQIISTWVGDTFYLSARLLPIHVIGVLLCLPFAVSSCITTAYAKIKIPGIVSISLVAFNIILAVVLSRVLSMGLYGIAIAAIISQIAYMVFFQVPYSCNIIGLSLRRYMMQSFIKPLLLSILISGTIFFSIKSIMVDLTAVNLLLISLLGATVFITYIVGYKVVFTDIEKTHISGILKDPMALLRPERQEDPNTQEIYES